MRHVAAPGLPRAVFASLQNGAGVSQNGSALRGVCPESGAILPGTPVATPRVMAENDNVIPFVPDVQQVIDRVLEQAHREAGGEGTKEDAGRRRVEEELLEKLRKVKVKFAADLRALYAFMRDPRAPAQGKVVAIGALLYFVLPVDLIPDFLPIIGFADDAAVIAAAVGYLNTQLAAYRRSEKKRKARSATSP